MTTMPLELAREFFGSEQIALAVSNAQDAPLMLKIIFWLLIILWAIGSFGFHDNPNWVRGSSILLIILFAILGFYTFGF